MSRVIVVFGLFLLLIFPVFASFGDYVDGSSLFSVTSEGISPDGSLSLSVSVPDSAAIYYKDFYYSTRDGSWVRRSFVPDSGAWVTAGAVADVVVPAVEVDDSFQLVDEYGVYCILKQERFKDFRKLPCFYWKRCYCKNVMCWERVQPLIEGFKGKLAEKGVGFDG